MVVNALYNMVDQIFIGWGVGYLGNGATNVVFPLTMVALSFALMFGDGASAYLSLKLGEKKKEEASKGVANGILLSIIVALVLCFGTLAFFIFQSDSLSTSKGLPLYNLNKGNISANSGLDIIPLTVLLNPKTNSSE